MIPTYTWAVLESSGIIGMYSLQIGWGMLVGLHRYSHVRLWHGKFFDIHTRVLSSHIL